LNGLFVGVILADCLPTCCARFIDVCTWHAAYMPGNAEVDRYWADSGLWARLDGRQPGPKVYVSNGSKAAL
jgi:hypothetical protein